MNKFSAEEELIFSQAYHDLQWTIDFPFRFMFPSRFYRDVVYEVCFDTLLKMTGNLDAAL